MKVTSGTTWHVNGNTREYSITLENSDGEELAGEEGWNAMSWPQRRSFLEKQADLNVLRYLFTEGVISREWLEQRAREIKERP